jgi:phage gp16-like protein
MQKQNPNTNMIRLIQVAIRHLGLKEEEYRALYEGAVGKRSLRAMTGRELYRVLEALKQCGFVKDKPGKGAGDTSLADDPQARKIRFLWLELKELGELRDSSEAALLSYIKRRTCLERMEWLNGAQKSWVIESLKSWVDRVRKATPSKRAGDISGVPTGRGPRASSSAARDGGGPACPGRSAGETASLHGPREEAGVHPRPGREPAQGPGAVASAPQEVGAERHLK